MICPPCVSFKRREFFMVLLGLMRIVVTITAIVICVVYSPRLTSICSVSTAQSVSRLAGNNN